VGPTRGHPDAVVNLEIFDNDVSLGEVVAKTYRLDLEKAGIGNGRHAFSFPLPQPLDPFVRHEIDVRRRSDGRSLPNSPKMIEPCLSVDPDAGVKIATLLNGAVARAHTTLETETLMALLGDATELARDAHARSVRHPRGTPDVRRGGGALPGKRALVIDLQWPRLDRDTGSQAIWSHICSLQDLDWEVHFVASEEPRRGDATVALEAAGVICHAAPVVTSVENVLRWHQGMFDLVYLHRPDVALAYAGLVRRHQPRARLLYSVADLHFLRAGRQAKIEGRPDLARFAHSLRERELLTMRLADVVITHSTHEAALLAQLVPEVRVHVVPWAVTPRAIASAATGREGVLFVGNFRHVPN
jgi:hypothetical protein